MFAGYSKGTNDVRVPVPQQTSAPKCTAADSSVGILGDDMLDDVAT